LSLDVTPSGKNLIVMPLNVSKKKWIFRLASICLGVLGVICIELVLRLTPWGRPDYSVDEFVGFSEVVPLFEQSEVGDFFETALSRTNYFVRDRFPIQKEEKAFRAFFLGGSTVQGRPYAIETAFPRWIQKSLEIRDPSRQWEMINCGGISYASYRLVSILEECLTHYQPDLIVLCTGQNEFLEERTYGDIKYASKPILWVRGQLSSWRLYQVMGQSWNQLRMLTGKQTSVRSESLRPILPSEVDAFLDYENGLEAYHWDPEWRRGVTEHFEHNVERMVRLCDEASIPLVILSPPVNLRSSPPFKSEHRADLTAAALDEWQRVVAKARSLYSEAPRDAIRWLQKAIELDPQYGDTHFALGTLLEGMGRRYDARKSLIQAKELDICPLRILESERSALARIAKQYGLPFVDLHAFLEERSDYLSLGSDLLVDHVHPSILGHQIIAGKVVELFLAEGWVEDNGEDWSTREKRAFSEHMNSLGAAYYVQGKLRLENLRLWTQGRTDGLPLELKPAMVVE
jgi:tetratricopeptide (TPR) repeat protein